MKAYTLRFESTTIKKGMKCDLMREARLELEDNTKLTDIREFLNGVKLIYKEIKKCYNEIRVCRVEFSIWRSNSNNYDEWNFNDFPEDSDGIYLRANEKYTEPERDLYLNFKGNILDDVTY